MRTKAPSRQGSSMSLAKSPRQPPSRQGSSMSLAKSPRQPPRKAKKQHSLGAMIFESTRLERVERSKQTKHCHMESLNEGDESNGESDLNTSDGDRLEVDLSSSQGPRHRSPGSQQKSTLLPPLETNQPEELHPIKKFSSNHSGYSHPLQQQQGSGKKRKKLSSNSRSFSLKKLTSLGSMDSPASVQRPSLDALLKLVREDESGSDREWTANGQPVQRPSNVSSPSTSAINGGHRYDGSSHSRQSGLGQRGDPQRPGIVPPLDIAAGTFDLPRIPTAVHNVHDPHALQLYTDRIVRLNKMCSPRKLLTQRWLSKVDILHKEQAIAKKKKKLAEEQAAQEKAAMAAAAAKGVDISAEIEKARQQAQQREDELGGGGGGDQDDAGGAQQGIKDGNGVASQNRREDNHGSGHDAFNDTQHRLDSTHGTVYAPGSVHYRVQQELKEMRRRKRNRKTHTQQLGESLDEMRTTSKAAIIDFDDVIGSGSHDDSFDMTPTTATEDNGPSNKRSVLLAKLTKGVSKMTLQ